MGASMLLEGREGSHEGARELGIKLAGADETLDAEPSRHRSRYLRTLRVVPPGLVGFGLCGLVAKGLDFDFGPWTLICASLVGLGLVGLGYVLSRTSPTA